MKDFLEKIVSSIVSDNTDFEIKEETDNEIKTYTIIVPQIETGKLIGKGGKVINSIRTLCRLKALKKQERILIKIGN